MSSELVTAADVRGDRDELWPEDEHEADALELERARATVQPVQAVRPDGGETPDEDLPALHVGDHVTDREDAETTMLVVELPTESAAEYEFKPDVTVADANPDYPADDDVVLVAFPKRTDATVEPLERYSFPRSRLRLEASIHDLEADAEVSA